MSQNFDYRFMEKEKKELRRPALLNIKAALQRKNMTQIDLAEKMGITRIQVNKFVNGNPSCVALEDIASAIGCRVGDLFDDAKANVVAQPNITENDMALFQKFKAFMAKENIGV